MRTEEIISLIKESKKKTPARVFVSGDLEGCDWGSARYIGGKDFGMVLGEYSDVMAAFDRNKDSIRDYDLDVRVRNSAIPMVDLTKFEARIEHGAIIRDMVDIAKGVVVMMGAVINIGARIGERTMIDMNCVIGGRAEIGADCHIGAGAVIAGVIEPPSAQPVIIEDNVLIGANAVVLEGIRVGRGAVVAAGAIVTRDVPEGCVVAGSPARVIKQVDAKTADKTQIVQDLRNL